MTWQEFSEWIYDATARYPSLVALLSDKELVKRWFEAMAKVHFQDATKALAMMFAGHIKRPYHDETIPAEICHAARQLMADGPRRPDSPRGRYVRSGEQAERDSVEYRQRIDAMESIYGNRLDKLNQAAREKLVRDLEDPDVAVGLLWAMQKRPNSTMVRHQLLDLVKIQAEANASKDSASDRQHAILFVHN